MAHRGGNVRRLKEYVGYCFVVFLSQGGLRFRCIVSRMTAGRANCPHECDSERLAVRVDSSPRYDLDAPHLFRIFHDRVGKDASGQ